MSNTLRKFVFPVAIIIGGWALGSTLAAPSARAASSERAGYKCSTNDACDSGTRPCCDDTTFEHCTTMCPLCTPNPCDDEM
jgi:hypothetical protein